MNTISLVNSMSKSGIGGSSPATNVALSVQKSFTYGIYDYYVFSSTISFTCAVGGTVNYIIIGGGGAGGGNHAGGGGAGGVAYGSATLVTGTTYTSTVGAGGTGGGTINTANAYTAANNNGKNSSLVGGPVNVIAYGGGYGGGGNSGYAYNNGTTGNTGFTTLGSGGGGMAYNLPINTATIDTRGGVGGNGVNNILYGSTGKNGGTGFYTSPAGNGGGGGGAGVAGGNASSTLGGNGGNGIASTITVLDWLPILNALGYMSGLSGTWITDTSGSKYVAAGGGGGSYAQNGWQPGTGGIGGGGAGGAIGTGSGLPGSNGAKYTGSGGGGGASTGNVGGNGGSGLVAIRSLSTSYTSFNLTNQYVLNGNTFGTIANATTASYTTTTGLVGAYTFTVSSALNSVNSYFMNMFTNASISGTYTNGVNKGWTPSTASTNTYTAGTGVYTGTTSTAYDISYSVAGEWIQIQLPSQIIIQQYSISGITDTTNAVSSPTLWILLGSNNGTSWSAVDSNLSKPYTYPTFVTINQTKVNISSNVAYLYYRIVINKTGGRVNPYISNINLIGAYTSNFTVSTSILTLPSSYSSDTKFSLWIDTNNSSSFTYNTSTNVISSIANLSYNTGSMSIGGNTNKALYLPSNSFSTTPLIKLGDYGGYSIITTNVPNINYQTELTFFWVVALDSTFRTVTVKIPQLYGPDHFSVFANSANIENRSTSSDSISIGVGEMGSTNNGNASNFSMTRTDFLPNTFHLISFQTSITRAGQILGFNGNYTTITTPFPGGGDTAYCAISSAPIFENAATAPLYFKEIICFTRALSTVEFKNFEGYLAWKWGINSKLATNHPFYNNQYITSISSIISIPASNRIVPIEPMKITWNSVSSSLTNYTANVTDTDCPFFSGVYTIYASSASTNQGVNKVFNTDTNAGNVWLSASSYSSGSSPYYTNATYSTVVDGNTVYGEWMEINLPVSDIMYSYAFKSYSTSQFPTAWIIAGASSHNGPWASITNNINNSANNVYTVPSVSNPVSLDLTTITGLKLWLDANAANTFSTSSGTLTWADKSGTNHNAVSNSTTTIVRNTSGLYPYVYFNAGDIANASLTIPSLILNTFPFTFFCVFNNISGNTDGGFLMHSYFVNSTGAGALQIYTNNSSGATTTITINTAGGTGLQLNTNTFTTNAFHIFTIQISSSNPNYMVNIDGTSSLNIANATFPGAGIVNTNGSQGIQHRGGTMYIAETILYQSLLTQSQYQQVEGYLASKWGLSANLPTTHPYYSSNTINTIPVTTTTDYSCYRLIVTNAYSNSIQVGLTNFYMNMLAYGSPPVTVTVSVSARSYLPLATNRTDIGLSPQTVNQSGTVTFTTISGKQCAYFDNNMSNFFYFNFSNPTQLTFCYWINAINNAYYTAVSISNVGSWVPSLQCDFASPSIMLFAALPQFWTVAISNNSTAFVGTWVHVAYTINQSSPYTGQIYINGTLAASGTGSGAFGKNKTSFVIGRSGDQGRGFYGYIRQFQFYNTILTSAQIYDIYTSTA